jgi:thioredoxin 1
MIKDLNEDVFKEKVFDYESNKDWKFQGNKPCVIDFYAEWCKPCKVITPILEELSIEYGDKIDVYKINIDDEYNLSKAFNIHSVPSLLFVPMNNEPQMSVGALSKETFKKAIAEVLNVTK